MLVLPRRRHRRRSSSNLILHFIFCQIHARLVCRSRWFVSVRRVTRRRLRRCFGVEPRWRKDLFGARSGIEAFGVVLQPEIELEVFGVVGDVDEIVHEILEAAGL